MTAWSTLTGMAIVECIYRYPDGHEEVLLHVPNYHFGWQLQYQLAEPRHLPAGTTIKAIGQAARARIEGLLGGPVFLDLNVKVLGNWRRQEGLLRRLGYAT